MKTVLLFVAVVACACAGSGSGSGSQEPTTPAATEPAATEPAPAAEPLVVTDDVIARGAMLYGENCAGCHGTSGEGGKKAPPVVGAGALPLDPRPGQKRDVQFRTAADVAGWVVKNMPPDEPGSLPIADYLAILAFDLKANGVDVVGKTIDDATLQSIVLH